MTTVWWLTIVLSIVQTTSWTPIRIRTTQAEDLSTIAAILSTAVQPTNGRSNWRTRIDHLWAKSDNEALLKSRHEAIREGKKASMRLKGIQLSDKDRLRLLWTSSERLRALVAKASTDTSEDNIWRNHNLSVPPNDQSWLYHCQITAEHGQSGAIIGFCEVAMLRNPLNGDYSASITNLATHPQWRRQGIARRLLQSAERFCARHWKAKELGLYVEQSNQPTLVLYSSLGYQTTMESDGGDHLGDMWHMLKALPVRERSWFELLKPALAV